MQIHNSGGAASRLIGQIAPDSVVIPQGSVAIATITEAQSKRSMGKGGKLSVNIDSVRASNADKISLGGVQGVKGGRHPEKRSYLAKA
jgi:hypothetical protein